MPDWDGIPTAAEFGDYDKENFLQVFGRKEGTIRALLMLIDVRGIQLSDEKDHAIRNMGHLDVLDIWFERAAWAECEEQIFRPIMSCRLKDCPSRPKPQKAELAGGADGEPDLRERRAG
ncbi:hypothetical protein [Nonomuraea sp. NPDC049695]|uniref:hypothetical protein n=1 Tax=Nonomuraea sp. NPDC049695 TaxID=3154734 RepID=UPI00343E2017